MPPFAIRLAHHEGEWRRLEQGSSPTNKTLYFSVFKGLKILLPPPSEQEVIAEVGESFDERIASEIRYLEQLRIAKRGLAQALLSGRVRVGPSKTSGARPRPATRRR
jgi:restriction endonuclease S subunit